MDEIYDLIADLIADEAPAIIADGLLKLAKRDGVGPLETAVIDIVANAVVSRGPDVAHSIADQIHDFLKKDKIGDLTSLTAYELTALTDALQTAEADTIKRVRNVTRSISGVLALLGKLVVAETLKKL